jgi:hypothetical protein
MRRPSPFGRATGVARNPSEMACRPAAVLFLCCSERHLLPRRKPTGLRGCNRPEAPAPSRRRGPRRRSELAGGGMPAPPRGRERQTLRRRRTRPPPFSLIPRACPDQDNATPACSANASKEPSCLSVAASYLGSLAGATERHSSAAASSDVGVLSHAQTALPLWPLMSSVPNDEANL